MNHFKAFVLLSISFTFSSIIIFCVSESSNGKAIKTKTLKVVAELTDQQERVLKNKTVELAKSEMSSLPLKNMEPIEEAMYKIHHEIIFDSPRLKQRRYIRRKRLQYDINSMLQLHKKISNRYSHKELMNYYQIEPLIANKFAKVLNVNKDRKLLSSLFPDPIEYRDRITEQLRVKLDVKQDRTIYIDSSKSSTYNQQKFVSEDCNVKKCLFTSDVKDIAKADAVLTQFPLSIKRKLKQKQIDIFYELESASTHPVINKNINIPYVNWSATYRRDSIINTPYERFTSYINISKLPRIPKRNFASGKSKLAACIISNCNTRNNRMLYVQKLNNYIEVDIYGRCGALLCIGSLCFEKIKKEYKFYLSFENSNCKDYVTEKFFRNALKNDVIPVVMGAHPNEYKRIAPPNSYIHVDDFDSPKQLAEYLIFLDKNDDAYNSYFLWKDTGTFINTKFICRLCAMVHLAPLFPMWYTNANKWWNEAMCKDRRNYYSWRGQNEIISHSKYVQYGYKRIP